MKCRKSDDSPRCTTAAGKTCGKGPPAKAGCVWWGGSPRGDLHVKPYVVRILIQIYLVQLTAFTLLGCGALNYIQGLHESFRFSSTLTSLPKGFVTWKQSPLPNNSNNTQQGIGNQAVNSSFPEKNCTSEALPCLEKWRNLYYWSLFPENTGIHNIRVLREKGLNQMREHYSSTPAPTKTTLETHERIAKREDYLTIARANSKGPEYEIRLPGLVTALPWLAVWP